MKGRDAVSSGYAGGGGGHQVEDGAASHLEVVSFIYLRSASSNIRSRDAAQAVADQSPMSPQKQ